MNYIDCWVVIKKSVLNSIFTTEPFQGVRGYWKDITVGGVVYECCNVLALKPDLDAFMATYAADIHAVYGWVQGTGLGTQDVPTIQQGVLDLLLTPPAADGTTSWGHIFFGQTERQFCGNFSTDFNKDFF